MSRRPRSETNPLSNAAIKLILTLSLTHSRSMPSFGKQLRTSPASFNYAKYRVLWNTSNKTHKVSYHTLRLQVGATQIPCCTVCTEWSDLLSRWQTHNFLWRSRHQCKTSNTCHPSYYAMWLCARRSDPPPKGHSQSLDLNCNGRAVKLASLSNFKD